MKNDPFNDTHGRSEGIRLNSAEVRKSKDDNYQSLKKFCLEQGADLFGVADIKSIKPEFRLREEVVKDLDQAVSIGGRLSSQALEDIKDAPTQLYFHHYKTANFFLDQLAFKVVNWIQRKNAKALAVGASQIVDWQKQTAHLSHKQIGVLAGLGWIGRNNLLVNSQIGSQFRLVTILTNLKLKNDKPIKKDCGKCFSCKIACPALAIKDNPQDFQHLVCFEKLKGFQKANIVGQYICGVCVKACAPKMGKGK